MAANDAFVAPNATVVGRVELRDEASIWYGAVVRGDHADVSIGSVANVQDRAVIETVSTLESGFPASVTVGDYTSVGAGSCLKSCVVEHTVDIGEGCVIDQGAVVQNTVVLEPGSVVPAGALITSGGRWAGNPAQLCCPCRRRPRPKSCQGRRQKSRGRGGSGQSTTRRPARPESVAVIV